MEIPLLSRQEHSATTKVVVASTVMLSFISFWRAAAIVLSDLGSTVYYVGGIAEQAVGRSAPWLILGVMLFSFAVRSVYMESSSMFVRGGVYVVVRDAMGTFVARLSVSALLFDYILTGPISSVSAGQYLGRLLNEASAALHSDFQIPPNAFAVAFAIAVTLYFWWTNIKGLHESSSKALRIMQVTTLMVVIFLLWCSWTLIVRGPAQIPPAPTPKNLEFSSEGLGWFEGTVWPTIPVVAIIIAFGHSLLSMSGFETLAQVYREMAAPKLKNLRITGNIVCTYAAISTGVITLLAAMIIPDTVRKDYVENLLGGLTMHLVGPDLLRLIFHIFVVIVGILILSGAVNTSIIGANGVMNRVAEDGVLHSAFQKPHRRFGTTYRIINLVTGLQLATIIASRGQTYLLGEAYAFGIVWSFFLKSLSVMVLRFQRNDQEYKTPLNLRIGGRELPVGLALTTLVLFAVALANLFSKRIATISGVTFMLVLFTVFTVSERLMRARQFRKGLEQFNLDLRSDLSTRSIHVRPGCILVAVRDYNRMAHLQSVLQKTSTRRHNIVVMTVRRLSAAGSGEYELNESQLFTAYEQELFTRIVTMAEKEGKTVELLVVPGINPFDAIIQTAATLQASRVVTGVSVRMDSNELARRVGQAWEKLPAPRHPFSLEITSPDRPSIFVNLGPHPPRLWPEDIDLLHNMWLRLSEKFGARLHHRDVVGVALRRMNQDLQATGSQQVLSDVAEELSHREPKGAQNQHKKPGTGGIS
ncbi:MAG: APC family permease [Acidobacteria bacterium]|nr:APC family permease [Acidobacteriota bacterium]